MARPDRNDVTAAAEVARQVFPDEEDRRLFARILSADAATAARAGEQRWSVTLFRRQITMNVGAIFTAYAKIGAGVAQLVVEHDQLDEPTRAKLTELGVQTHAFNFDSQLGTKMLTIPTTALHTVWPLVEVAHLASVTRAARRRVGPAMRSHSPGVVRWMEEVTGTSLTGTPRADAVPAPTGTVLDILGRSLGGMGLHYHEDTLAAFYTALQTKGFVILGGISGTGKTKLVQALAKALGRREIDSQDTGAERPVVFMKPYMPRHNRMVLPRRISDLFDPPAANTSVDLPVMLNQTRVSCRLGNRTHLNNSVVDLGFRADGRAWLTSIYREGRPLTFELNVDDRQLREITIRTEDPKRERAACELCFLPVRPDWRDSRPLLGYFNPITSEYVSTSFIDFVAKAADSWRARDGRTWLVVLDEMNLARVEYYFADVLSVMESGRLGPGTPDEGSTEEPLPLDVREGEGSDEAPARTMRLPPNLFVVGTVNVDETTHAFSPKVLDRAFFIDLTEVDFTDYPPSVGDASISGDERARLVADFTVGGQFSRMDKKRLAQVVSEHGELKARLQKLNERLREHDLHFGYRVFDEIFAFVDAGLRNGTYDDARGGADAAFDAAVSMKVLPKLHGSVDKLREPLLHVLRWCAAPDGPEDGLFASLDAALSEGKDRDFELDLTAKRVLRMLRALKSDGYASFV